MRARDIHKFRIPVFPFLIGLYDDKAPSYVRAHRLCRALHRIGSYHRGARHKTVKSETGLLRALEGNFDIAL